MPYPSPRPLRRYFSESNEKPALFSFDVFDTLVYRPFWPPLKTCRPAVKLLHRAIGILAKEGSFEYQGRRPQWTELHTLRFEAARQIGDEAIAAGDDPEIPLDRWIHRWLELACPAEVITDGRDRDVFLDQTTEQLARLEIETDLRCCRPVPGMREQVLEARRRAGRVVFISDMYYKGTDVARILDRCGYANLFDTGFVSADTMRTKPTGRLFEHALAELDVEPTDWIHTGDNRSADVEPVERLGGRSIHLPARRWPIRHQLGFFGMLVGRAIQQFRRILRPRA